MKDQKFLNKYFYNSWVSAQGINWNEYKQMVLDDIDPENLVIDVGCGSNMYKGRLPNVIGIDPANDAADFYTTIEDYTTDLRFDVAICNGSINFGERKDIEQQIEKIISLLKPKNKIYWRVNPGYTDHRNSDAAALGPHFFPWTEQLLNEMAEKYNYEIVKQGWHTNRIYSWWHSR